MSCCSHCRDADDFFTSRTARRELRRYRRKGPPRSTTLLLDGLRGAEVEGASLLDIGGGIGAIQHELFDDGLARSLQVDASEGYLALAREEARKRGHDDRASFRYGDAVDLAPELPTSDLVTLDRVICCYPDLEPLLEAALSRTGRLLGLVYPRNRWFVRVGMRAVNLWQRLRGSSFRVYLHEPTRVEEVVRGHGLRPTYSDRTILWHVVVFARDVSGPLAAHEGSPAQS
jgi:SAM-dependent methyltransferase